MFLTVGMKGRSFQWLSDSYQLLLATAKIVFLYEIYVYHWLSARLWKLQCVSTGVITVVHFQPSLYFMLEFCMDSDSMVMI